MHPKPEGLRVPFLLRFGVGFVRALAVLSLLAVACHPTGDLNVRVNGELIGRSQVLTWAYPAIVLTAVSLLVLAYGIKSGRPWSRPLAVAFWITFIGLLLWVGGRAQVWSTLAATIPVAAFTLLYLYFSPAVQAYNSALAQREAQMTEVRAWLDTPNRRERGA
jgi:hypothetical protein